MQTVAHTHGEFYKKGGANMTEEIVTRKNPFCVISKSANEHGWHDLQTNSAWSCNHYGEAFAVVPDDMVEAIMETCGYCDIELNEDGTEVVSFTPTEIPVIEAPESEPTEAERLRADLDYLAIMTGVAL